MSSSNPDPPLVSYLVVKHSWRGKYKRVLSIGGCSIYTTNPNSSDITNKWPFDSISALSPVGKFPNNEFLITGRKDGGKTGSMKFSSDYRSDLITDALKQMSKRNLLVKDVKKFRGTKYLWNGTTEAVFLDVYSAWVVVVDMGNQVIAEYDMRHIDHLVDVDYMYGGISIKYGGFGRNHLYAVDNRDGFVGAVTESARSSLAIDTLHSRRVMTFDCFIENKFGSCSHDEALTSYIEFPVTKVSRRLRQPVKRLLCITGVCLVERDPFSYSVVTCRKLDSVFSLICDPDDPQLFSIEYTNEDVRSYASPSRDVAVSSLLDSVRASGNSDAHVKVTRTNRGYRLIPFHAQAGEEIERINLKLLYQIDVSRGDSVVDRFNANVAYRGLLHSVSADTLFAENKEKMICLALTGLTSVPIDKFDSTAFMSYLFALRRLFASKAGFNSFTRLNGLRERVGLMVVMALKLNNDPVTHAAIEVICALMQPMHPDSDLYQEQLNKTSLLSSTKFIASILSTFEGHIKNRTGALVITSFLDFLTFALCTPYSETTPADKFDVLLGLVSDLGRTIFKLFEHPSLAIVKGAGLVLKALVEEGTSASTEKMQIYALAEGSLIRHLYTAVFTTSNEPRMMAHKHLSRRLLELWTCDNEVTFSLFSRILPPGLVSFLYSSETVPEEDAADTANNVAKAQSQRRGVIHALEDKIDNFLQHWRVSYRIVKATSADSLVTLRRPRKRVVTTLNWRYFYHQFSRDHSCVDLIWNYKTREELRITLENEIKGIERDKELLGWADMSWNFQEFEVTYKSLEEILEIGGYYIRYLIEEKCRSLIKDPYRLFNNIFRRFLTSHSSLRWTCLHAMTTIYETYYLDVGLLPDCHFFMALLDNCSLRFERDRLIIFISKLMLLKENCKILLTPPNVKKLIEMMTLAHLHLTREVLPAQSNVIEASPDSIDRSIAKEWHIAVANNKSMGPYSLADLMEFQKNEKISFKTRVWCNGMDNWAQINLVPQLKWQLMTDDNAILTESEIAILLLDTMISVCDFCPSRDANNSVFHPIPKIKMMLSSGSNLAHLVQLLLTFYPPIVERVAQLICKIVEDNPIMPKLYQSGVFFFIMMYTGSNIQPIARFLKMTHSKQSFYCEREGISEVVRSSILNSLLPEAMIYYLYNYSPEEFSRIYLGEFDNPEVIWNSTMKNHMIERISVHISDYTVRLMSNVRALYQFCPLPLIVYPKLEDELFCNIFYLRNFCNLDKFKDWPVRDPVVFLRDLLLTWKQEIEKKPSKMNMALACEILGLKEHEVVESKIRHSYYKLAQKYHPDKNIEGREMFEKMSSAYHFLTDKLASKSGPDENNVILLMKSQSILYNRFREELNPYKYSGYPLLVSAIRRESNDPELFHKQVSVLDSATELCYWTISSSHLNAEELRREDGLQVLQLCFCRCCQVLSESSNDEDRPSKISANVLKCFAVAAMFDESQSLIQQMSTLIDDIVLTLRLTSNLPRTCNEAILCIKSLSCVDVLQMSFFQRSVLCYLCPLLFEYDYTLEEGGVESDYDTHLQALVNQMALYSIETLACLSGFATLLEGREPAFNHLVRNTMTRFMTPFIMAHMESGNYREALKLLNCNSRNPYIIWDRSCRKELNDYCRDQKELIANRCEVDPFLGAEFAYSAHEDEVLVEGVYIRVYNEQPQFIIQDPPGLSSGVYKFIERQIMYLGEDCPFELPPKDPTLARRDIMDSLECLHNLLNSYNGLHKLSIPSLSALLSLLYCDVPQELVEKLLQLMTILADNQDCIGAIAELEVVGYLLFSMYSFPELREQHVVLMTALMSSGRVIKEAHSKGLLILALDMFCNSPLYAVRMGTIAMVSKIMGDKLMGPRIRIEMVKYLPQLFVDSMTESSSATLQLFDNSNENPELIWNTRIREAISARVQELAADHHKAQSADPQTRFKVLDTMKCLHEHVTDELMVGGVYLRLLINNPRWVLHRPREFMVDSLDEFFRLAEDPSLLKKKGNLETITTAVSLFFHAQPSMVDMLVQIGILPKFLKLIQVATGDIIFLVVRIMSQIVKNQSCLNALSSYELMQPLKRALLYSSESLELTINILFDTALHDSSVFTSQALNCHLFDSLLEFLSTELGVPNPKAVKALIVKTIKQFASSSVYGAQINELLSRSQVWNNYKNQLHDLFISSVPEVGYLTAGASVAGYLTSAAGEDLNSMQPPPNI